MFVRLFCDYYGVRGGNVNGDGLYVCLTIRGGDDAVFLVNNYYQPVINRLFFSKYCQIGPIGLIGLIGLISLIGGIGIMRDGMQYRLYRCGVLWF